MTRSITISFFVILALCVPNLGIAQNNDTTAYSVDDLFNVSMEELLSLKVESASKKVESSMETPLSVTVLTAEEISNSGATTIAEAFRLVPGMIVRQESNGNYDVHIRGLDNIPSSKFTFYSENTMTLVMLDGQKMYNHINGGTWWETFPISVKDIEKIEVVRGPSTALYGPNAATGVINIVTKKAKEDGVHVNGSIQSGAYGTTIGNAAVSYQTGKVGVRVGANFDLRDRFETQYIDFNSGRYVEWDSLTDYTSSRGFSRNKGFNRWGEEHFSKDQRGVYGSVDYDWGDSINTTLFFSSQLSDSRSVFMESTSTMYMRRLSQMSSVALNTVAKGLMVNLSHQFGEQDVARGNATQQPNDIAISDVVVEYQKELFGKLLFQPGVSFQRVVYNDLPNINPSDPGERGILNAKQELRNTAFYMRTDYNVIDDLRLIAAVRADKYQTPDDVYLSWQLGATYGVSDNTLLRYVFSRANRGPFIADLFTDYRDGSVGEINFNGNTDLNLATIMQHEVGLRSKITDKLSIDLELFASVSSDFSGLESVFFTVLDPSTGSIRSDFVYDNYTVEATQLGATMMMSYKISDNLGVKGFITMQETRVKDLQVYDASLPFFIPQDPVVVDGYHKNTPTRYGGLLTDIRLSPKLLLNSSMYFYSSQLYQHRVAEEEVPSNMIWNMVLKYNVYDQHVLFVNARNAFNTNKREFGFIDRSKALVMGGLEFNF